LIVDGCCLQDVGVFVQPFALPTMPAVAGFAHRWPGVGHMLGDAVLQLQRYAELLVPECELRSLLVRHLVPFWPTHPDVRMYDSETMR